MILGSECSTIRPKGLGQGTNGGSGIEAEDELGRGVEQGARNAQCADRPGDQACRWEWPRINDYKSAGCIKLAPDDLAALEWHFRKKFRAGARYPTARVVLRVIS